MLIRYGLSAVTKFLGGSTLAIGVFWQVAVHSTPPCGVAYIHVMEADVEVTLDNQTRRVEGLETAPLVRELSAGRHTLRMAREGRVVYEESFEVQPGQEVVLSAWDHSKDGSGRAD